MKRFYQLRCSHAGRARVSAFALLLIAALGLACLDADPLDPNANEATVSVHLTYYSGAGLGRTGDASTAAGKSTVVDSLVITVYDVTPDVNTNEPAAFPIAATAVNPPSQDDATGTFYEANMRIDLSEERFYRVVARVVDPSGPGVLTGERTIDLVPGATSFVAMVMTAPGVPAPGTYDLAVVKSFARSGARGHEIPIVLTNADSIGGIEFEMKYDAAAVSSVTGIRVDPSSRLYVSDGTGGSRLIPTRVSTPSDSTLRVLTVDLSVDGDSLTAPLSVIEPGQDLLFFVVVDLASNLPALPDTFTMDLGGVFFSTPSGSTEVAVSTPHDDILIMTP
ncbi:MAG: hypothetical protein HKN20_06035 [Gemmatimonadetes bacterium]|nr:hypothetical protein [Gemmatimonadota bacterium]